MPKFHIKDIILENRQNLVLFRYVYMYIAVKFKLQFRIDKFDLCNRFHISPRIVSIEACSPINYATTLIHLLQEYSRSRTSHT